MKLMKKEDEPKVLDKDGYEIEKGGLVLHQEMVWKVVRIDEDTISPRADTLWLWNIYADKTKVPASEVQWLCEDTITKDESKKKRDESKKKKDLQVGDFVRRKNGTGRVARITEVKNTSTGLVIKMEYFYDGAYCTGELFASEVEPAEQPDDWVRMKNKRSSGLKSGRNVDTDGQEFWIGGCGSDRSKTWGCRYSEKPKKPEKKDSISRGDLIREEVDRLKQNPTEEKKEAVPVKIKTRKPGEW